MAFLIFSPKKMWTALQNSPQLYRVLIKSSRKIVTYPNLSTSETHPKGSVEIVGARRSAGETGEIVVRVLVLRFD
jgi:hypothetical protein